MKTHVERILNIKVVVCDKCLQACCWQGIFMCDFAYHAGTTEKTIRVLKLNKREHPTYWKNSLA